MSVVALFGVVLVRTRGRHSGRPARPAKIHPDRAQPADFHPDRAGISHPDPGPSGRAEPDLSPIFENLISFYQIFFPKKYSS